MEALGEAHAHGPPPPPQGSSIWIVANTAGMRRAGGGATVFPVWVPRCGRGWGTGRGPWDWALERGAVWAAGQAGEGPAGIQRER